MKAKRIVFATVSSLIIAISACSLPACADWETTDNGKMYSDSNGDYVKGWQKIDGKKYYFNSKGIMQTGWLKTSSGKYYYFKKDGSMATGTMKINGEKYKFSKKGVWDGNGTKPVIKKKTTSTKTDTTTTETTTSKMTDEERAELQSEYNSLKIQQDNVYKTLKTYLDKYEAEKKLKQKDMDKFYEYMDLYNATKSNYYKAYYEELADYYKEEADIHQKEMDKISSQKASYQNEYDKCKKRMSEIKTMLKKVNS